MIRIVRPMPAPQHLTDKAPDALKRHEAALNKHGKLEFDNTIYGHKSVKDVLVAMQHKKCAFCEADVRHVAPGDVEHFRPKAGVKQCDGDALERPGYWWLAYEWENLLFACSVCNSRGKGNLFPLENALKRCRKKTDALTGEKPLFINPADPNEEDPEHLIEWRGSEPVAANGNMRARVTITALGLDRSDLWDHRREHYRKLERAWRTNERLKEIITVLRKKSEYADMVKKLEAEQLENDALFDDAKRNTAEYAGMIRAAYKNGFQ